MSVFALALVAALIAGATSAWFTDDADVPEVEFTAGTLEINVDEEPQITAMEDRFIGNVNPGDCATVCWEIENSGSKSADLRVKIDGVWDGINEEADDYDEDVQVAFFIPALDSSWVTNEDGWIYYTGGPVAGTYNDEGDDFAPETVKLCLVVAFDGPNMGNAYQGASYTLSGTVEAVQGTNGAAEALWEVDMEEIKAKGDDDNEHYDYFQNVICYTKEGPVVPDPEKHEVYVVVEGNGTVTGAGSYKEGDDVTLEAVAEEGYEFVEWQDLAGLPDVEVNGEVLTFTMPGNAATVKAKFKAVETPQPETCGLTLKVYKEMRKQADNTLYYTEYTTPGIVQGAGSYEVEETVTLKAAWDGGRFIGWYTGPNRTGTFLNRGVYNTVDGWYELNYTITEDVTLYAYYQYH